MRVTVVGSSPATPNPGSVHAGCGCHPAAPDMIEIAVDRVVIDHL